MKCDFLILYEVKNREFENVCLIKNELERRGYKVLIRNTWNFTDKLSKIDAEVVLTPWLYNTSSVYFVATCVKKLRKVVNLQWEQVHTNIDEDSKKSIYNIRGCAKNGIHFSWGTKNRNRLVNECKIDSKNVKIVGNITLDFFRQEFKKYFLSKEELLSKYNLPTSKRILLFISSFAYVNLPEEVLEKTKKKLASDVKEFVDISINSQMIILKWIETYLEQNQDVLFIYRPHPAEIENSSLKKLEKCYYNFRVIGEMSIKQWIVWSDNIFTWYSTSAMEVLAANKPLNILRPIKIPKDRELTIANKATTINTYDEFVNATITTQNKFPLSVKTLSKYYEVDKETPVYIKVSDELEGIHKNNVYKINFKKFGMPLKDRCKLVIRRIPLFYNYLYRPIKIISNIFFKKRVAENISYTEEMKLRNQVSNKEYCEINERIHRILESVHSSSNI